MPKPESKHFQNPDKHFVVGDFKKYKGPKSPSPKRADYEQRAVTKPELRRKCTYIHHNTGKRCRLKLDIYPEYCHLHTMMIENVYVDSSKIAGAGNGLFVGPYGFRKGDIIGKYSYPWNSVSLGTLEKRCKNSECWDYIFCDYGEEPHTQCWDGLDIRSTVLRNANDAHKSKYRNNAYFKIQDGEVYAVASKNLNFGDEIYVSYGPRYWK